MILTEIPNILSLDSPLDVFLSSAFKFISHYPEKDITLFYWSFTLYSLCSEEVNGFACLFTWASYTYKSFFQKTNIFSILKFPFIINQIYFEYKFSCAITHIIVLVTSLLFVKLVHFSLSVGADPKPKWTRETPII